MRRAGLALFAAVALLAAAVPAWSGDDGKLPPQAELAVSPQPPVAGEPAVLDASASRDPDGSVTSYAWDVDGDGAFERQSGAEPTLAHAFDEAGERSVGVRVVDDSGDSADARTTVSVAAPPEPEPAPEPAAEAPAPEPAAEPAPRPAPRKAAPPRQDAAAESASGGDDAAQPPAKLRAAASASVSIKDFSFAPRSVTVSVGDTVTWTNTGKEVHTATARDGSFDTGNISAGASGSATMRKAGTFSYFCKPHAFMTASVTVTGGGSGGGGGGGDTQDATGTGDDGSPGGSAEADASGGDLPSTGLALWPFLAIGVAMIASGAALRRQAAHG